MFNMSIVRRVCILTYSLTLLFLCELSQTGAENHQAVCSANASSPDADKDSAGCDRDEGDIVARLNAAAQCYFEWMPIRHAPGTMGVIDVGTITQIISWGDMAT
jgi:hypothetical protein